MSNEFCSPVKKLKFSNYERVSRDKLLVNGDFFISLSQFKGKIQAFQMFNMRYIAVVKDNDLIQIYNVYETDQEVRDLNDDIRRTVLPEMQLNELVAEFPSNFNGQVRHVTGAMPP